MSTGNRANFGLVCEADGWIYYADGWRGDYNLRKCRPDMSEDTLLHAGKAQSIGVVGDEVYFIDGAENYKLCKIGTDGSDFERLTQSDCYFPNYSDGSICCTLGHEGRSVFRMNMYGGEPEQLNTCPSFNVTVYEDMIYFTNADDDFCIYSMNLNGGQLRKLSDDSAKWLCIRDGKIYYTSINDNFKICSINTDG